LVRENRRFKSEVSRLDNQLVTLQIKIKNHLNEIDRLKALLQDLNQKVRGLNNMLTKQINVIYEYVVKK
jgi:peptidoglycan hydrolase CwlO-like protein